jgi:hypothetical protein
MVLKEEPVLRYYHSTCLQGLKENQENPQSG